MKNNKVIALLLIILCLTAVALVVSWAVKQDTDYVSPLNKDTTQTGTTGTDTAPAVPTPEVTVTPFVQNTVAPTVIPVLTPEPTVTPAGNPATTPAPVAVTGAPSAAEGYGASLGTGTFSSDTGTVFNMVCQWSAKTLNANEVCVTVDVYAVSYSLYTCSLPCTITAGSLSSSFSSPAISYDGPNSQTTALGSKSFTFALSSGGSVNIPLSVTWAFAGRYSGVAIDSLNANTTITLTR